MRCLLHILSKKKWKKTETVEDQLLAAKMSKVAELVEHLLSDEDKIDIALVTCKRTAQELLAFGSKKRGAAMIADLNDSPQFSNVKVFWDIPYRWFIGWLRQFSKHTITDDMARELTKKSSKELNNGMSYITGHV